MGREGKKGDRGGGGAGVKREPPLALSKKRILQYLKEKKTPKAVCKGEAGISPRCRQNKPPAKPSRPHKKLACLMPPRRRVDRMLRRTSWLSFESTSSRNDTPSSPYASAKETSRARRVENKWEACPATGGWGWGGEGGGEVAGERVVRGVLPLRSFPHETR